MLTSQGKVSVWWLAVVVVGAAIAGSLGYEVGHHFGLRILKCGPLRSHHDHVAKAQDLIAAAAPKRSSWAGSSPSSAR
ncbi:MULTISPECIES: hypothetical protein [unclassified Streptomyces]|uniref:hypothetical protein n=1 Tax=Streptomyces TaxID=1883 RepID=UPI00164DBB86|nr:MULTISPECIES: hypothetical protein [unclassified Streptomyces]MCZ4103215.1 hypothetical protein [Streptomyces sp. H39-C1]